MIFSTPWIEGLRGRLHDLAEDIILWSRYLLMTLYWAQMLDILVITVDFFRVLTSSITKIVLIEHTMQALELLDITMVANLIWLIGAGSYYVFVHPYPSESKKKRPRSLTHISSGLLKEKMAGSMIGVSSVHLLQVFLNMTEPGYQTNWTAITAMCGIHTLLIVGFLAFNIANRAEHQSHNQEERPSDA